ncbi:MAG TPA: hypothetical protein VFK86_14735 [Bauldia sp.]|nr:hypothetical protein [Bauldia sp.]
MLVKRLVVSALIGASLTIVPLAASAESPFGNAKRVTLSADQMKDVTGTYAGPGDSWGYYGQLYAYYAYIWAYDGYVYDYPAIDEYAYYNQALYWAKLAKKYIKWARNAS